MRRSGLIALCAVALPAVAAEPTGPPPDPAFLEFLAELPDEEESFVDYLESANGEQELKRAEKTAAAKDVTDE